MQTSTLLQLLQEMSVYRRNRLRRFLQSPYHNQREDVLALFEYIDQHIEGDWAPLSKAPAFQKVYPGQVYDERQLRYLMSFLMKNLEQFLITEQLKEEEIVAQRLLLQAYRDAAGPKSFQKALRRARQLQEQAERAEFFYHDRFAIEREEYLFRAGRQRDAPSQLPRLNAALDEAYLISRLKQSCLLSAHQAVFREEEDGSGLLALLMGFLEDSTFLDNPLLAAYYYYLKAVENPVEVLYYQALKELILPESLPPEERRPLFLLAINYGIRQFNDGQDGYLQELFELYRTGLAEGLLLPEGRLSRFAFKNITAIALRLRQFEWTERFIEGYQQYLPPRHRENYVHYCLSKLRFEQGGLGEAMERLRRVEYEDLFLNIDAKIMLMKIYYERQEHDALDSFLKSFERFLRRHKELTYHRENYFNIIYFTRKLLEVNPFDKEARAALRQEVEGAATLTERGWLLERV
ncbi:MAG: hypothetical protein H6573_12470 [Lewinellaceae bacterium]|nr:hypothetical protein [Phaeodactylibacter sp.]MCB9348305.1 hypothetical protein [Lewinellaceae bacterium]